MRYLLPYVFASLLVCSTIAGAADDTADEFWKRVVANATSPIDGHFLLEVTRVSRKQNQSESLRTHIEYWVQGSNLRIEVRDQEGRDLNSQVVLKNSGQITLNNFDRDNDRVVVSESAQGSAIAESDRSLWLYFQPLLGRFPFSPLALYRESFDEFSGLSSVGKATSNRVGDLRVVDFTFTNGRRLNFMFRGSQLNPYAAEVFNEQGLLAARLTTEWKTFSSSSTQEIAHSGVFELLNANGLAYRSYEWKHLLAEDIQSSTDPFTWEALSLSPGKKLTITSAEGKETNGGYWDGSKFSDSPLAIGNSTTRRTVVTWLSVLGLCVGLLMFVLKLSRGGMKK